MTLPDVHKAERKIDPQGLRLLNGHKRAVLQNAATRQVEERVEALFRHYDIKVGRWKTLALALAFDHVLGFRTEQSENFPSIETVRTLSSLYRYINHRRATWRINGKPASARTVCTRLPEDQDFLVRFPELAGTQRERLQNLYSMSRKLRKQHLEMLVARWRRGGVVEDSGFISVEPPQLWITANPVAWEFDDESVTDGGVTD